MLARGARFGPYEVREPLGAGGMGEVYRAGDARLGREVALKILPEHFALDARHLARFEREARLLAALNHSNIAAIYGLEESGGRRALVLELVEGITLATRLAEGPLPLPQALAIARQIADALDVAHEQGIVHRDLKPANIVVRPDGTVKVLDFGVAKALEAESGNGADPTMTTDTALIGTAGYASPEQVRGLPVDRRTDIWAFGCVLYEMLTGLRAFEGDTKSDAIVSILERTPDWDALPPGTPPLVRRLLQRCMEKDLRRRLRNIGDARWDLEEPLADAGGGSQRVAQRPRPGVAAIAGMATIAAVVALAWFWTAFRPSMRVPEEPVLLTTVLPPGVSITRGPDSGSSVAVSPDGRLLVIAGTDRGGQRLYSRPLDRLGATPLPGTERGSAPFFSWDGTWIGFIADGRLKRIPVTGGAPLDITRFPFNAPTAGASWGRDDRIVFAYGHDGEVFSVDARGGEAEPVRGVESGYHPELLPDGTLLFVDADGWIRAFDRSTGRSTRLVEGSVPRYADGYLILGRGPALLAATFDPSRHRLTGPLVPIVDAVDVAVGFGARHYSVSNGGTLAYLRAPDTYELVIVQADGTERVLTGGARSIQNPQFSPDGRFIVAAAARGQGEPENLWIHDLEAGTATRLTFDAGRAPVWTDSANVTYSHLGERGGIYSKRVDGRGEGKLLLPLDTFHWLVGWTPDQRTLVYGVMEGTPSSISALTDGQTRRIIGPGNIWGGRLSGDGQWLTYYSRESGNFEVYVTPFPDSSDRWLVAEGTDPAWGPGDDEVYYRSGARLMAARIDKSAGIRVLSSRVVIELFLPPLYDDYDLHPDGQTLVIVRPEAGAQAREVTVIVNWPTEVRRLLGQ